MGAASAGILAVGLGAGWLVDSFAGTTPIFIMVGLALGILGAGAHIVTTFRRYLKTDNTTDPD
jgi:F0F1-type ATP synthase assembly protein I